MADMKLIYKITYPNGKIYIGKDLTGMTPGSLDNLQMVVADADVARNDLLERGIEVSEVDEQPWGRFVYFSDPDGNRWALQQLPDWSRGAGGDGDWEAAGVDPSA